MRDYFATMEIKKMMISYAENIFVKMKEGDRIRFNSLDYVPMK